MRTSRLFLIASAVALLASIGAAEAQVIPKIDISITPESGVETVTPRITWNAVGVKSCVAGGGWSGAKALSGTELLPATNKTQGYTLACITEDGRIIIGWTAPTQNTDGSPLTDLAGFKVYRAQTEAALGSNQPVTLNNPQARNHIVDDAAEGVWWLAVTAFNARGVESVFSAAASKDTRSETVTGSVSVEVLKRPNPPTAITIGAN